MPEVPIDLNGVCGALEEGRRRGKTSYIIVVAEGAHPGGAEAIAESVKARLRVDCRVSVIGHIQRGGAPTAFDRTLASRLGRASVEALLAGKSDCMTGEQCGRLVLVPLPETWERKKPVDLDLIRLAAINAT